MTATRSARVGVDRTAADAGTFSDGGVVASSSCQAPPSGSLHTRRSLRALARVVALAQEVFMDRDAHLERYAVDPASGCWRWLGGHDQDGYGRLRIDGVQYRVHRLAYEAWVGPIPDGLTIDHVLAWGCIHRDCINPAHLEAVTTGENTRRGRRNSQPEAFTTHCKNGHEFTPENTLRQSKGCRRCRTCKQRQDRESWRRRKSVAESSPSPADMSGTRRLSHTH